MSLAGSLSAQETSLADDLIAAGVERAQAVLAVAMYTRGHSRPEFEIVDLVRQYAELATPGVAETALAALRRRGWVVEEQAAGDIVLCYSPADFPARAAELLGNPGFAARLEGQRRFNQPRVAVLGHMHDPVVYETFGPRIRAATHEILLPMINTTPRLAQVADMQFAAKSGVSVKILMATPTLAARIRGNISFIESKARVRGWMENVKGYDTFEVRMTSRESDLWLASSLCQDGRLVRLDVFDPGAQRTTQGVMVEVSTDGSVNLALLFRKTFDESWGRSRVPGARGWIAWAVKHSWLPASSAVAFALSLLLTASSSVWVAFTGGVAAGLVSNYLPRIPVLIGDLVSRLRR